MTTDGTPRRHMGDEALTAMTQLGTFAEYGVVAASRRVIRSETTFRPSGSLVCAG